MWSLHVLPVFAWVFSGCSSFPHHQNMYMGLSAVSTLDQGTGLESGVGPRVLRYGCPLLLRDGLNARTKFHDTVHVTKKVPLPLNVGGDCDGK